MKFSDIKTKKQLKDRVVDGILSVGCHWLSVKHLTSESKSRGLKKITVIYTASPGSHKIVRYI